MATKFLTYCLIVEMIVVAEIFQTKAHLIKCLSYSLFLKTLETMLTDFVLILLLKLFW